MSKAEFHHPTASLQHSPQIRENGVLYRLWSPDSKYVSILIEEEKSGNSRRLELKREPEGWFLIMDREGKVGDLYTYILDYKKTLPDVASRFQPKGIKGPSQVIGKNIKTKSFGQNRIDASELVIYELHVGTFSKKGTFAGTISHLDHIKKLGATAIQVMPIAAFPGKRNWGYDVALPFAPADAYGRPEDLLRLIEAAHERGLAMIIDVVYNHVCGEPNYLLATSPYYFKKEGANAWGSSLNFDGEHSEAVRAYFKQNAIYWLNEFDADGLRLDAIHAIVDESPVHILKEITEAVQEHGGFVIAEDDRNDTKLIKSRNLGGFGMDAVWADDFHHVMKMALKPEPIGYFKSYDGTPAKLAETLENGWLFRGQYFGQWKKSRGTECRECTPGRFIYCISNHDQTGNRPLGERLNHLVSPAAYRAASMFFLLLPYTPMLFMGQEWAATSPFCFFTNHEGSFGPLVSQGRLNEFKTFGSEWPAAMISSMPDPEAPNTFTKSRLKWSETEEPAHNQIFELYRACLNFRKNDAVLRQRDRGNWKVWTEQNLIFLRYGLNGPSRLLIANLSDESQSTNDATSLRLEEVWKKLACSNERRFGGDEDEPPVQNPSQLTFRRAQTILLTNEP